MDWGSLAGLVLGLVVIISGQWVTAIKLIISNFKSNAFSIAYGNLAKR